jgi:hypothetical protein
VFSLGLCDQSYSRDISGKQRNHISSNYLAAVTEESYGEDVEVNTPCNEDVEESEPRKRQTSSSLVGTSSKRIRASSAPAVPSVVAATTSNYLAAVTEESYEEDVEVNTTCNEDVEESEPRKRQTSRR